MTLFKHRPSMDSRMSIDMIQYDNEASDSEGEAASLTRPSMDSSTYLPSTTGRSRSASDAPSTSTSEYRSPLAYPDRVATAIDIVPGVEALASSSSTFLSPTGTPSSPGHPMSQSTSNIAGLSPPARPAVGRSRASTLRSIFSSSPLSGESGADVGRSPYGQGFSGSRSTTRLAGSSTLSVASLNIGSPLTHTLGTCSFVLSLALPRRAEPFLLLYYSVELVHIPKEWLDSATSRLHLESGIPRGFRVSLRVYPLYTSREL